MFSKNTCREVMLQVFCISLFSEENNCEVLFLSILIYLFLHLPKKKYSKKRMIQGMQLHLGLHMLGYHTVNENDAWGFVFLSCKILPAFCFPVTCSLVWVLRLSWFSMNETCNFGETLDYPIQCTQRDTSHSEQIQE